MALDHRIQETMLDGPRLLREIFREVGPIGKATDWSPEHLQQRLERLAAQGRVIQMGELWALRRLHQPNVPKAKQQAAS